MNYKLRSEEWLTWKEYTDVECSNFERALKISDDQFIKFNEQEESAVIQGSSEGSEYITTLDSCSCPFFHKNVVFSPCKHMFALAKRLGHFKGCLSLPKSEDMTFTSWRRCDQVIERTTSTEINTIQFGRYQLSSGSFPLMGFNEAIELKSKVTGNSILLYFLIGLKYIYLVPLSRSFEIPVNGLDCAIVFGDKRHELDKIYDSDWGASVAKFSAKSTDNLIEVLIRGGNCTIELIDRGVVVGTIYLPETHLFANTYSAIFFDQDMYYRYDKKVKKNSFQFVAIELSNESTE